MKKFRFTPLENGVPLMGFTPIGVIHTSYTKKNEIPIHKYEKKDIGKIEIFDEFKEGLKDIEGFSHIFVIFVFNMSDGYNLLAQPPFDTGLHGVFSTKSPNRPNPIGLTVVELKKREDNILVIKGVDMLDGTPVLDIKPFLGYMPEYIKKGWLEELE